MPYEAVYIEWKVDERELATGMTEKGAEDGVI